MRDAPTQPLEETPTTMTTTTGQTPETENRRETRRRKDIAQEARERIAIMEIGSDVFAEQSASWMQGARRHRIRPLREFPGIAGVSGSKRLARQQTVEYYAWEARVQARCARYASMQGR